MVLGRTLSQHRFATLVDRGQRELAGPRVLGRERDRVVGSNGNIFGDGDGHRAFELPVAKKQRKYQRSDGRQLYDAGNDKQRQRRKV